MYGIYAENGQVVVGGVNGVNLQNGMATLNTSGDLTIARYLYLTGNTNGYLWNNGGYIRQSGGNGFVADGTITAGGTIISATNGSSFADTVFINNWYGDRCNPLK